MENNKDHQRKIEWQKKYYANLKIIAGIFGMLTFFIIAILVKFLNITSFSGKVAITIFVMLVEVFLTIFLARRKTNKKFKTSGL